MKPLNPVVFFRRAGRIKRKVDSMKFTKKEIKEIVYLQNSFSPNNLKTCYIFNAMREVEKDEYILYSEKEKIEKIYFLLKNFEKEYAPNAQQLELFHKGKLIF